MCLPVERGVEQTVAPNGSVGIDLGLKDIAVTSDGERLEAGRCYRGAQCRLGELQRRGHRRQAARLHRRIKRRRQDACHQFSHRIVSTYQNIVVGDVSSLRLAKTRMAKAVLDSGWGMLKRMLQYKGEYAGCTVEVVSERNTTRVCSNCGAFTGPRGLKQLVVRFWECACCGEWHDRDVNAARNILLTGSRCRTSVRERVGALHASAEPDIQSARGRIRRVEGCGMSTGIHVRGSGYSSRTARAMSSAVFG
jgi:putative transposase